MPTRIHDSVSVNLGIIFTECKALIGTNGTYSTALYSNKYRNAFLLTLTIMTGVIANHVLFLVFSYKMA